MEQILHVNPTKEDRKPTNTPFIIVLGLVFLIWLAVGITAMVSTSPKEVLKEIDELSEINDEQVENSPTGYNIIDGMTLKFNWAYIVCTIISLLIAMFYLYFLSLSKSKFITELAVYLLCIWMICVLILNSVMSSMFVENIMVHLGFIFTITYTIYIVMSFRSARNVGTKEIFEIIKDSCRAVTSCYAIPIFLLAVSVIIALLASMTVYIFYSLLLSYTPSKFYASLTFFLLNGACGVIFINFFFNFIRIVISGYAIDWYWMKDQQLSSTTFLKRSITRVLRYHIGTLAFSSIPLLSYIYSVFQACRPNNSQNDPTKIYNVFTRFCGQLCTFLYITDFALIQTSVYGSDYTTAIAAAHDLVAQNNHEINMAVTEVSLMVARIGYILIAIPFVYDRIESTMYSILTPFSIIFMSAVQALLVNKMIIDNASQTLQEGHDSVLTEIPKSELPEQETQPTVY